MSDDRFTPEDFRYVAKRLRETENLGAVASNNLNVILAALDLAGGEQKDDICTVCLEHDDVCRCPGGPYDEGRLGRLAPGLRETTLCPGCHVAIYDQAAKDGWCTDCNPKEGRPVCPQCKRPFLDCACTGPLYRHD